MDILVTLLNGYMLILLARVVISWIQLDNRNPIVQIIYSVTEPVLAPIRNILPIMGGFDLSPIVAFFGIQIIRSFLLSL